MLLRRILVAVACCCFLWPGPTATAVTPPESTLETMAFPVEALEAAATRKAGLSAELEAFRRESRALAGELAACRILLSTSGNLATLPESAPEIPAEALTELRRSRVVLRETLDRLVPRREALAEMHEQTERQSVLNRSRLARLKNLPPPAAGENLWTEQLAALIRVQQETLTLIEKLDALHKETIDGFRTAAADLAALEPLLEAAEKKARRTAVFRRSANPLARLHPAGLAAEAEGIESFMRRLRSPAFWHRQTAAFSQQGPGSIATLLVLGAGLLLVLWRLRSALGRGVARIDGARRPWRAGLLIMLQRTVVPLGLLTFCTFAFNTGAHFAPDPRTLTGALLAFLWVWLPGRWVRCFFGLPLPGPPGWQRPLPAAAARRLVSLSRLYAAVHILLTWSLGPSSMLEALARAALEIALVVWLVVFGRRWRRQDPSEEGSKPRNWCSRAGMVFSHVVVLAAPVLELAGYGPLALYWYKGWGLTLTAVIWAVLCGRTLREIEAPAPADARTAAPSSRGPLQWTLLRLAWLLWAAAWLASLVLAWGGWRSLVFGLGRILTHPVVLGDATFRLSGALSALLVLFFTHLAVRSGRLLLTERLLARSGLTRGGRDSVITVSTYLIWAGGILLALHVFGISTTSLMVAFGALGIGLGFGLQNIFNNFVGGLILLFERPIQVGDDIEIGGTWARVMQINVRATVVQTYAGATLIIPNSEFISNAVINWSHRDPNLRRQIDVGVAYGSDTELVRRTLLEAAANTALVSARPAPEVLFTAFGESTLDFRLRIWTTVDEMLRAETALRFEIDRLFRLRGIEIAFPQRDLHVRSLPAGSTLERALRGGAQEAGDDHRSPADEV